MNKIKLERIASQIIRELSNILYEEAKNEVLKSVTIIDVDVSNDLGLAKVYYTFLGDYEREFVEKELEEASRYLRTELAERIEVRHTPALRFIYDESIAYGENIERKLKEIQEKEN